MVSFKVVTLLWPLLWAIGIQHCRCFAVSKSIGRNTLNNAKPSTSTKMLISADIGVPHEVVSVQISVENTDIWVFVAGLVPFVWATIEFWRRIAFGEPFGTGTDSVIIGKDDSPKDSRGRRVLGRDALVVAYILFAVAFATLAASLYAVISSAPFAEPPSAM